MSDTVLGTEDKAVSKKDKTPALGELAFQWVGRRETINEYAGEIYSMSDKCYGEKIMIGYSDESVPVKKGKAFLLTQGTQEASC